MRGRCFLSARPLALLLTIIVPGCHRTFPEPASVIRMGDAAAANQLTSGFYPPEGTGWRWTAKRFSVILKPPLDAGFRVTTLSLSLFIPQTQLDALGTMTLKAVVGECPLAPETFSKTGLYTYKRDIPRQEALTNILPVKFSFDRANTHIAGDPRELGAIVNSVGVQSK